VTDEGGMLCHAAIVSREFDIPCVIGTGDATRRLRTGDMIEISSGEGRVKIISRAEPFRRPSTAIE
jgi:phosphoenolpyruvate synthase/pyruvate phosphate dikinase